MYQKKNVSYDFYKIDHGRRLRRQKLAKVRNKTSEWRASKTRRAIYLKLIGIALRFFSFFSHVRIYSEVDFVLFSFQKQ